MQGENGFGLKDIVTLYSNSDEPWFKRPHVGKFLCNSYLYPSTAAATDKYINKALQC